MGECFQWKAHGQCSNGDSCSFSHDIQDSGNRGQGQRPKGRSSSSASHSKAKQTDGEGQTSSQGSGKKQENSLDKSVIPCRFKFCKKPSCKFWHPPEYLNYKSERKDVYMVTNANSNKKSKKGGAKGSVATSKESFQLGCVSQDSCPRRSIPREKKENWDQNTPSKCTRAPGTKLKFGKERVHREVLSTIVRLMSSPCAPKFEEDHTRRLRSKNDAPAKRRGF